MPRTTGRISTLSKRLAPALAVLVLVLTFRDVNGSHVGTLLSAAGVLALPVVVAPQLFALASETWGWRISFSVLGLRIRYSALFGVRVATEGLALTLPAGAVVSESFKPLLLGRLGGLSIPQSLSTMAVRKYLLVLSQAMFLSLVFVVSFSELSAASQALLGAPGLQYLPALAALLLGAISLGASFALHKGAVVGRLFELLSRLPSEKARSWLKARRAGFDDVDGGVVRFFAAGRLRAFVTALPFVLGWALEAFETYLLLRLLGVEISVPGALGIEALVVLIRHLLFMLPAGLGAQDLGYVAFLSAFSVPDPVSVGAAFSLLKRSKEAFVALVGYLLLSRFLASTEKTGVRGLSARGVSGRVFAADRAPRGAPTLRVT